MIAAIQSGHKIIPLEGDQHRTQLDTSKYSS